MLYEYATRRPGEEEGATRGIATCGASVSARPEGGGSFNGSDGWPIFLFFFTKVTDQHTTHGTRGVHPHR